MQNIRYFKAVCSHCGEHIEFPETAVGRMIECPHCSQQTQLRVAKLDAPEPGEDEVEEAEDDDESDTPASAPAPRTGSSPALILSICCPVILLIIVGVFFLKLHHPGTPAESPAPKAVAARTNAPALTNAIASTNPPEPPAPKRPKALSDLKVGAIEFEKTKGSSLVYAVGTINNDSEYQHFGVRVLLDLFNEEGNKVGTAQDYKDVIEPHKSWHFRALIHDFKAVSAKVAEIKEVE